MENFIEIATGGDLENLVLIYGVKRLPLEPDAQLRRRTLDVLIGTMINANVAWFDECTDEEYETLNSPFKTYILGSFHSPTNEALTKIPPVPQHSAPPSKPRTPQPMQAHPYGGITPPQISWKFDITDIVDINGTEYKIMSKELQSYPSPNRYLCLDMDSGSRQLFEKDAVEKFELSTTIPPNIQKIKDRTAKLASDWGKGYPGLKEFQSQGRANRCPHSKTKINHAGGINFKQCCDCKEDLGDV